MPSLPPMTKHRGFPSGLHGTGFQFTIRRANPKGVTAIKVRKRVADRNPMDKKADAAFVHAIWHHFGAQPFERGNLDAGRLSWLFGQEIIAAQENFDPASYEAMMVLNEELARRNFPQSFGAVFEV